MKTWKTLGPIAGLVLHVLIGGLMVASGLAKVLDLAPGQIVDKLNTYGLGDHRQLIGWGELIGGVLLVFPRTFGPGVLVASGFWGGVISIQMAHQEDFLVGSTLLFLTWLGAWMRRPDLLLGRPGPLGPAT